MTGTDGHPEVGEISALTEGVLSPSRTADVREHLAGCELCEDVRSSLNEIRGALGTLPGPPRMPADIAGRIDAALAAEALLDSTTPPSGVRVPFLVSRETGTCETGTRETGTQETGTRETEPLPHDAVSRETEPSVHGAVSRETGAAPRKAPARETARPRPATGPGRQGPPPGKPGGRRARRRWPAVLLGSACVAAAISVGGIFWQSGGTDAPPRTPAKSGESHAAAHTLASGDLTARVQELLRPSPFSATESHGKTAESPESPPSKTLNAPSGTAPLCVRQGIGRSEQELISEPETYQGEDAYLVVLPHPGDGTLVDAFVVSATCVDAGGTTPGKVLLNETLPRT